MVAAPYPTRNSKKIKPVSSSFDTKQSPPVETPLISPQTLLARWASAGWNKLFLFWWFFMGLLLQMICAGMHARGFQIPVDWRCVLFQFHRNECRSRLGGQLFEFAKMNKYFAICQIPWIDDLKEIVSYICICFWKCLNKYECMCTPSLQAKLQRCFQMGLRLDHRLCCPEFSEFDCQRWRHKFPICQWKGCKGRLQKQKMHLIFRFKTICCFVEWMYHHVMLEGMMYFWSANCKRLSGKGRGSCVGWALYCAGYVSGSERSKRLLCCLYAPQPLCYTVLRKRWLHNCDDMLSKQSIQTVWYCEHKPISRFSFYFSSKQINAFA